jgi:hypothetical protein
MILAYLIQQLHNISVHEIIRALERDGFVYRRTRESGRVCRRPGEAMPLLQWSHVLPNVETLVRLFL